MPAPGFWAVEIDGFSDVCVWAVSYKQACWRAAKACFDAGYGYRRDGPFSLIRRGIKARRAGWYEESHLPRVGEA